MHIVFILLLTQIRSHEVSDVIACDVCKLLYENLATSIKENSRPGRPAGEEMIFDILESICDAKSKHGSWILHYDIKKSKNKLEVVKASKDEIPGKCLSECRLISKTCGMIIEEADDDANLSPLIYKQKLSHDDLCYKLSTACTKTDNYQEIIDNFIDKPFKEMGEQEYKYHKIKTSLNLPKNAVALQNEDEEDDELSDTSESQSWFSKKAQWMVSKYLGDESYAGSLILETVDHADTLATNIVDQIKLRYNKTPRFFNSFFGSVKQYYYDVYSGILQRYNSGFINQKLSSAYHTVMSPMKSYMKKKLQRITAFIFGDNDN